MFELLGATVGDELVEPPLGRVAPRGVASAGEIDPSLVDAAGDTRRSELGERMTVDELERAPPRPAPPWAAFEARVSDRSRYRTNTLGVASDNGARRGRESEATMSDNSEAPPPPDLTVLAGAYRAHLERSAFSPATRRAYGRHAAGYLAWLAKREDSEGEALSDPFARDFAVRDYRRELKARPLAPASINAALAAIDHLYRFRGLGVPRVPRDALPDQAPRALSEEELRRVLRAAERCGRPRDRAVVALMAFAGLRVSEVAQLDVGDVALSARKGSVTVRLGKGELGRTVPLGADARGALDELLRTRANADVGDPLLVGRAGTRLTARSLDRVIRGLGRSAGVELSPHVLRHTFVTRLVRGGVDVVIAAELAGHRSLETTRRYAKPTAEDRARAVELAGVDY
jgi:site-specific recombinase XerD